MAVLSLLFSCILYSSTMTSTLVSGESLYEPNSYELIDGGEYFINVNYCDFTVKDTFTMTGRCWCWYDPSSGLEDCSVPGPTLIVYNGSTISLTVTNNLVGSPTCDDCNNEYRDPDVINLHTHGLYISGEEDHVLLTIEPGESYTYEYNIHEDHYPGTMWYHAHHHGSSAYQVATGLFGALIVKNTEQSYGYLDENLLNMKSNTLIMHHMIMADSDNDCDCDSALLGIRGSKIYGTHLIGSACNLWCDTQDFQTEASGAQYDMIQSDNNDDDAFTDYFLVNSQINPSIDDVQVGEFRKLQIINGQSDLYIHMDFDEDYDCEYYLLGRDGIWFKDGHRDLCDSPTNCHLFVSPGGRADLAVKCDTVGSYTFHTSTELVSIGVATIPSGRDGVELFTINVVDDSDDDDDYVTELPGSYPSYPYHLGSLLDEDNELVSEYNVITQCGCSGYDDFDDTCQFDFGLMIDDGINFGINDKLFEYDTPQFYLNLNEIYEFSISSNAHPYHMHVRPFQLMDDVVDGYFSQKGDFMDTLGAPFSDNYMIRFINLDYDGTVVLHCHLLQHEDTGMITFMEVVDSDTILDEDTCEDVIA